MKKIKLIMLLLISFSISCEKEIETKGTDQKLFSGETEIKSHSWGDYTPENLTKVYNEGLKQLAFGTANALQDLDFRIMLKQELLNKVDGDYDVIFKNLKEKEIKGEKISKKIAKGIKLQMTAEKKQEKLESFGLLFKQLQLSMPVNIDKWDANTDIPIVAFLEQTNNDDSNILTTINEKGEVGIIDGKTFPKVPVIVINLNERSDINGDIDPRYDKNTNLDNSLSQTITKPKKTSKSLDPYEVYPPDDVAGQYMNSYNIISWSYPAEYGSNDYIQVEREMSGYWELIYETYAINGSDSFFDSNNIEPGYQYVYRIRTKRINPDYSEMYSYYSPIIIVDAVYSGLATPTNSTIIAHGPNEISLTWVYPTNINISGFKIQARKIGNGDPFFNVATLAAGSRSYLDLATKELGAKYQYTIVAYNGSTESGTLEDIVYNPFRSSNEQLYLTNIYFYNITEFEYWYLGTPEVEVSLAHLPTPNSTQPTMIFREEFISVRKEIIERSYDYPQAQYGYNLKVLSGDGWDNYFYQHVLSFNFIEYDAPNFLEGWKGISFNTKIPIKIGKIDIQATSSIDLNFSIRNRNINLGSTYVAYWFPEEYSTQVLDNIVVSFSTQEPNWEIK